MSLLWPGVILLLGLLPLIVAAYVWVLRRRRRFTLRYSSLALVRAALPRASRLRRHLPFGLFVVALGSLVGALARPVTVVRVPAGQATILLAIDISRSMCATDVLPSRLDAAKAAALSFIRRQQANTQIGVVAFAGFAELVQPPTTDRQALEAAITALSTARATAIGSGILESVNAIAEIIPGVAPAADGAPGAPAEPLAQPGSAPAIIVLLTDGVTTTGVPPLEAAQQAAARGIRIYTIGFGTASGGTGSACRNWTGGGSFYGGGGGGFRRGIDEATLEDVAEMTGGAYYSAESADALHEVFATLPISLVTRLETTEISFVFAAMGALLAAAAMLLGLWWQPLP